MNVAMVKNLGIDKMDHRDERVSCITENGLHTFSLFDDEVKIQTSLPDICRTSDKLLKRTDFTLPPSAKNKNMISHQQKS